ncbi:MAG: exopolysaccharide biosynthesis protein [Xanthobacteraceae bacterium]
MTASGDPQRAFTKKMEAQKQPTASETVLSPESDPERSADNTARGPASEVLQRLLDNLPPDRFTLGWLSGQLHRRSFGVIVMVLALISIVPGISYIAGLLLLAPAIAMVAGRSAPSFPHQIATRPLPARHLAGVVRRAVPVLRNLERIIRPRWQISSGAAKRLVGVAVVLLTAVLLLTPLPLAQVVPALIIVVLSVAYIEDDGLLLSLGFLATLVLVAISAGAVWGMIAGAKRLGL